MNCLENVGVGSANVRIAATSFIQSFKSSDKYQNLLPGMMQCLVEVLNGGDKVLNGGDEAMKQKALVLLIKLAETKPSFFTEHLVEVVDSMLQIAEAESLEEVTRHLAFEFVITLAIEFVNEQNKPIIKILGYTISMLGHDEYVANTLLDRVESNDSSLQESALLTFAQFLQYVIDIKVPYTISLPVTRLHDVFMNCLGKVGSADVRISALIAVTKVIQCLMTLSERNSFQDLLPGMMQCLTEVLNGGDEAMTQKALVLFIELAGTEPSFFKGQLEEVVGSMLQIAEAESLEEGTRHLAIKFVIMLAEVRKRTPLRMEDLPQSIVSRLFVILMRMLSDVEDEGAWHSAENEDEDASESSNYSVGQEYLDRLAIALGGDTIFPVAYVHEQLHAYLAAPDREWQERLAAVVALAQIAKGRSKVEIPNLEQVVTMVLKLFKDPHPRVRWAATNAIGQLSTYVGPSLQDQYHDRVLPALYLVTMVLAQFEDSHSRVRLAAIHVTGLLSTDLAPDLKLQYHRLVLPALAKVIYDFEKPEFQAHAVSAVVNISKNFPPDTSMPDMLEIVGNLRQFRHPQKDTPLDQTRILAIENLLKQFRAKLPQDIWASTRFRLSVEQQGELFLILLTHR